MKKTCVVLLIMAGLLSTVNLFAQETDIPDSLSIFSVVEVLDEAVASAEKKRVVYRLDRQKLSGAASLAAEGGTAVDVLRSIPSVRVDAEGTVSFRGSTGFLVYIDGHQSILKELKPFSRYRLP